MGQQPRPREPNKPPNLRTGSKSRNLGDLVVLARRHFSRQKTGFFCPEVCMSVYLGLIKAQTKRTIYLTDIDEHPARPICPIRQTALPSIKP